MSEMDPERAKELSAVVLTKLELDLLKQLDFSLQGIDYEQWRKMGPAMRKLTESLLARHAIPRIRLRYMNNPEFNTGRTKRSHLEVFEANGTRGQEIFEHPHFMKYLHYLIFGPNLPQSIIQGFGEVIRRDGGISSGTHPLLWKFTREQARRHGYHRDPSIRGEKAEEFFRLALEWGLDVWGANQVRKEVMRLR